jgi:hypothetical protein
MVPGFTVAAYLDRLRELHGLIESDGPFVAHSSRYLIEARKPRGRAPASAIRTASPRPAAVNISPYPATSR